MNRQAKPSPGAAYALASAALFGASTPVAKALVAHVDPWLLAGLLYLGAGVGLLAVRVVWRRPRGQHEAPLAGRDWLWLMGATVAGGIAAPVLLMAGLARTPAATASLLLNLEAVFTALLAWFVVRESSGPRVVAGLAAIVAGAVALSWQGPMDVAGLAGPLAVAGACLLWAVDNNLTRHVALSDPLQVAMIKGLAAGAVNVTLAFAGGVSPPGVTVVVAAGIVGFFGYGLSLALFVLALRHVGTARTGAYFATAPFIGAVVAVVALREPVTMALIAAGVLMALGTWLHLTERHEHEHVHEPVTHTHRHIHDQHHLHVHAPADPAGEPHTHRHTHARLTHRHPHYPDAHHRHGHGTGGTA